jgi:hypothetical protein
MKLRALAPFVMAALIGAAIAIWVSLDAGSTVSTDDRTVMGTTSHNRQSVTLAAYERDQRLLRALGPVRTDPFSVAPRPPPPSVKIAPPPPPIVAPAPPAAPPFPYRFVGRVIGPAGEPVVYLAKDQRLLTVHGKGDLGDDYRVDELTDRRMVVTHGASQQQTVIEFGVDPGSQSAP